VQIDEQALADRIAGVIHQIAAPAPAKADPEIRRALEDILAHLRQQSREANTADFPLSRLIAVIVQCGVAICLMMAIWDAIKAWNQPEAYTIKFGAIYLADVMRCGLWLLGGLTLQGFVIALLLQARKR